MRGAVRHLVCLVLFGLTIAGCHYEVRPPSAADLEAPSSQSSEATEPDAHCGDWAELADSGLVYQNNVWGKGDVTDYEQCSIDAQC